MTAGIWSRLRALPAPVLVLVAVLTAVTLAPVLVPGDPLDQHLHDALAAPGGGHLLGTDDFGRDVLLRLLSGTRTVVFAALAVVAVSWTVGLLVGTAAGLAPRRIGGVLSGAISLVLGIPGIIVAIAIIGALGPGVRNTMLALCLVGWAWYARLAEQHAAQLRRVRFVRAARVAGAGTPRLLRDHVVPHVARGLAVVACMDVGYVVLAMAALGFMGLGAQQPDPDLGLMLRDGQDFVLDAPWLLLAPSAMVLLVVLPFVASGERAYEGGIQV